MEKRVIVDSDGHAVPSAMLPDGKLPPDLYFMVADVWVINSKNQILLQKRSDNKPFQPSKWAMVGGQSIEGEDTRQTIAREFLEEMGIDLDIERCEKRMSYRTGRVWGDAYFTRQDIDLSTVTLQTSEVSEVGWFSIDEIEQMERQGVLFPHRWNYVRGIIQEIVNDELEKR